VINQFKQSIQSFIKFPDPADSDATRKNAVREMQTKLEHWAEENEQTRRQTDKMYDMRPILADEDIGGNSHEFEKAHNTLSLVKFRFGEMLSEVESMNEV